MKINKYIILTVFLFIILISISILFILKKTSTKAADVVMNEIGVYKTEYESNIANITEFTVYGNHFNLKGNIKDISEYDSIDLVLIDKNNNEYKYNLTITKDNNIIYFNTSDLINEGINLEDIKEEEYYIAIKINYLEIDKYYLLSNKTNYENIEYYTITKDSSNNKIDILFNKESLNIGEYSIMKLICKSTTLPNNVYDIVIDPGHGGKDSGAVNGDYYESKINLSISLKLKTALEKLGLKVKLTRTSDVYVEQYGLTGRAVIPNNSQAKYTFSMHLNSTENEISIGGVEVYSPSNANLDFASNIAKNIVSITNTNYSLNNVAKVKEGVYVKNFTTTDIEEFRIEAKEDGYELYNITTNTPYFFMIRETGGIMTHAYIDGRNTDYGTNIYYNSNMGSESYLLELRIYECK